MSVGNTSFPWTIDQYQRYLVLREFLNEFYYEKTMAPRAEESTGTREISLLDIGGLSPCKDGSGCWLPVEEIGKKEEVGNSFKVVVDLIFFPFKEKRFIQANGLKLPFQDATFDVVSALDVLEHIDPDKREVFIDEMCRVCSGSVIISAPFLSEEIEEADRKLLEVIKRVLGVQHRQLQEHQMKGLPEKNQVSEWLRQRMKAGVEFSFGSLTRWLYWQTIRVPFLGYSKKGELLSLLDRLALSFDSVAEFQPPFSRHFWIYTRTIPLSRLAMGVENIKEKLATHRLNFSFSDSARLSILLKEFWTSKKISAIVISRGNEDRLRDCLRHLLSQKIEMELEISVCLLNGKPKANWLREFPGIKFYEENNSIQEIDFWFNLSKLKGDWLLLVSEDVLLPPEAVFQLWKHAQLLESEDGSFSFQSVPDKGVDKVDERWDKVNKGEDKTNEKEDKRDGGEDRGNQAEKKEEKNKRKEVVISPRLVIGKRRYGVWFGGRFSILKFLAGRWPNPLWKFSARKSSWLYSECLFFPREVLFLRKRKSGKIKARNIFLWEAEGRNLAFVYCPDIVVYKKSKNKN